MMLLTCNLTCTAKTANGSLTNERSGTSKA
jgi:hypothetical protein